MVWSSPEIQHHPLKEQGMSQPGNGRFGSLAANSFSNAALTCNNTAEIIPKGPKTHMLKNKHLPHAGTQRRFRLAEKSQQCKRRSTINAKNLALIAAHSA
jgi:hypothetical protein